MHTVMIRQRINQLLEKISEQHTKLEEHTARIPQVEIDILLSGIRELYEAVRLLEKNNTTPEISKEPRHPSPADQPTPAIIEKKSEPAPKNSSDSGIKKSFVQAGQPTVASQYKEETSLYDRISKSAGDKSLGSKLQKKPISDLKSAIGINEKFIFISELFDGNQQEYLSAVETLNNCSRLDVALTHLNIVRTKFGWDEESKPAKDFIELVERKFL